MPISEERQINWKNFKVNGNKWLTLPDANMVRNKGQVVERKVKLTRIEAPVSHYVIYDREYVVSWLQNNFFKNMMSVPYNDMTKIFSDAYRQEKEAIAKRIVEDTENAL